MTLTFREYQARAGDTATYPDAGNNPIYPTLGLAGEAGEVAEKVKKVLRGAPGSRGRQLWCCKIQLFKYLPQLFLD